MTDPLSHSLASAPVEEEEEVTPETAAALDRARASLARGEGIPHEDYSASSAWVNDRTAPVVLSVKVIAAAIVQDADAYQRLLDVAASSDGEEGIRQGIEDLAHGRTRRARKVFDQIRRKHDIPR